MKWIWLSLICLCLVIPSSAYSAPIWQLTQVNGHLPDLQFTLTDDNNNTVTEKDFRGDIILLYFGYTHCPDECPAMMNRLANILSTFKKEADNIRILFVTVDPDRDTPAVLNHYLNSFDPAHMIGLTGNDAAISDIAKRYRLDYQKGSFSHSDAVYIFDRQGTARLIISLSDPDERIIHDIQELEHHD